MPIVCPKCGSAAPEGARFCEVDGTPLGGPVGVVPAPVAVGVSVEVVVGGCRCGAGPEAEADGYCTACGKKWIFPRVALPRDHVETALSPLCAALTDRGQRHERNEDDFALAAIDKGVVLVVCDGVSSSKEADQASGAAVEVILEALSVPTNDPAAALRAAIWSANEAVSALYVENPAAPSEPPETTVVTALVQGRTATIAWVGDSRAYWIDAATARSLTHDHSWMNDMTDTGEMTPAEAAKDRRAHAITRCLGASDDPDDSAPSIVTFAFPETGGTLLLCTDGLWNYASTTEMMAKLIHDAPRDDGATSMARSLVAWANAQGGHDNITAAVLLIPAASPVA